MRLKPSAPRHPALWRSQRYREALLAHKPFFLSVTRSPYLLYGLLRYSRRKQLLRSNAKVLAPANGFAPLVIFVLVVLAVWSRLLPHPPNFAPIAAAGIFSAALLPRRYALTVPFMAMVASDLIIGLHSTVLFTWGAFLLVTLLASSVFQKKLTTWRVIGTTLLGSLAFFVITNFGVWLDGRLYARTFAGLWECYVMALPFFRNTLLGDLVYTGALFGLYALCSVATKNMQHTASQAS